ncbi:MAG: hypothetical protein GXY59_03300 [Bacteroidales bacterium]|nr:hypothetical protein [Bacteroidales bacterium]
MKVWRKMMAILVLLPFLVSVSGVVVFHTHCQCTGRDVTSLFVPPVSCEELEADHHHLFTDHARDLQACCVPQETTGENPCSHDCGCHSPRVEFYKLKLHFTDDKPGPQHKVTETLSFVLPGVIANRLHGPLDLKSFIPPSGDPPVVTPGTDLIHVICQPKIPGLI